MKIIFGQPIATFLTEKLTSSYLAVPLKTGTQNNQSQLRFSPAWPIKTRDTIL